MLGPMIRVAALSLLPLLAAALPAQKTLAELQRRFVAEAQQLDAKQPTREQRETLLARHTDELQAFVADVAAGDDRWNGRLMLADLLLARRDRDAAGKALQAIDAAAAPALVLTTAATMAQHLGLKPLRDGFVQAAIGKDAPLTERFAMARMLMTVLREIPAGERIFADALAAATDDEQRALVRWQQADALRDREDLPENAGFEELEKLARDLPQTYWGGVAKDRLRATQLARGDAAIDFRARTLAGGDFALADGKGKVVVLAFLSIADRDLPTLAARLQALQQRHGDALVVCGVALDRDAAAVAAAAKQLGMTFPLVCDGKGAETDAALRWFIEGPTVHVIDKAGKVAALGLHVVSGDAQAELDDAVAAAVKAP